MEPNVIQFIQENKGELIEHWLLKVDSFREEQRLQNITNDIYKATNQKFIDVMIHSIAMKRESQAEQIKKFAKEQIQLGWPLQYLTKGLQTFRKVLLEEMEKNESFAADADIYHGIQDWIDHVIDHLVTEYAGSWEKSDQLQKLALRELTAPLIPVFEGISVMPLIGTIDTDRAKLIMENLLDGVIKYESQVVLIDITGVPIVDTMVAHHLMQSSDAVRLVGGDTILVGIRPEIAQTIVNLGLQLGKFKTTSTLQKGIQLALDMTERRIVPYKEGDAS